MDHVKTYPVAAPPVVVGLEPAGAFDRRRHFPLVSHRVGVQRRYEEMRRAGESHNMAEMLALRTFPATRTDVEFNRGRCNGNQFETTPGLGDYYAGVAQAAGVSVTGKHYCSGLAEFPGDPDAWVSGRSDVLRVAREKGLRVTGLIDYDPGAREAPPDVEIAADLVESEAARLVLESDHTVRPDDARAAAYARLTGRAGGDELRVKTPTEDW